jgi:hypothetical protein
MTFEPSQMSFEQCTESIAICSTALARVYFGSHYAPAGRGACVCVYSVLLRDGDSLSWLSR